MPIGASHRNGLAESTVKILKKSLRLALKPGVILKYSELITLVAKIAHSVNSRPIGLSRTSGDSQQEDFLTPLTPNHLLKPAKNLRPGDVVMMHYANNLVDDYRLARVCSVQPDAKNLVRTVTVKYRKKNKTEKPLVYSAKPLTEENVAVQRLSLLVAMDDDFN